MSNLLIKRLSTEISSSSDKPSDDLNKFVIKHVSNNPYIVTDNADNTFTITDVFYDTEGNTIDDAIISNDSLSPITPVTIISLEDTYEKLYGHSIKGENGVFTIEQDTITDNHKNNFIDISYSYDNNNVLENFLSSLNKHLDNSYTKLDTFNNNSKFKAKDCLIDDDYDTDEEVKL